VAAGGFCFLSGTLGLDDRGRLVTSWSELAAAARELGSGIPSVDAVEGPPGAQTWAAFERARSVLQGLGGDLDDLVQLHLYQREKRFFPVHERVRRRFEPEAPAPASGIGVADLSLDGTAWFALDGIAIDRSTWPFGERRRVLHHPGEQPAGSHYSQAVLAGPYVFLAGQIPLDGTRPGNPLIRGFDDVPEAGRALRVGRSHPDARDGPIAAQTWFTYDKIRRVLTGAGQGLQDLVHVTVYLQDMKDYATFHRVHQQCLGDAQPALTVVEAREVGHKGTLIEIEATAMRAAPDRRRVATAWPGPPAGAHAASALVAGPLVFVSGQIGVDATGRALADPADVPPPARPLAAAIARVTGRPVAASQACAILDRLDGGLAELGAGLERVTRLVAYMEDLRDFVALDLACRHYFPAGRPALSCVVLPRVSPVPGARVCVEATAVVQASKGG
jgi:enamine deaminase RidA (YjgF/YER057c/UK114 family)